MTSFHGWNARPAKALHVRAFVDGRKATLVTSDFGAATLRDVLRRTIAAAAFVARDEFAGLPERFARSIPDLGLRDPAIAERDEALKVEEALELERAIRKLDPRIVNSNGSHYSDATSEIAMANSGQFCGIVSFDARIAFERAGCGGRSISSVPVITVPRATASANSKRRRRWRGSAVRRAVEMFGARKPATMRVPVIFERDVAAAVVDDCSARSIGRERRRGQLVAGRPHRRADCGSETVTIVDDGRMRGRFGSSPFDGEGVATRRTVGDRKGRARRLFSTIRTMRANSVSRARETRPAAESGQQLLLGSGDALARRS